jgi:hypothetical protein
MGNVFSKSLATKIIDGKSDLACEGILSNCMIAVLASFKSARRLKLGSE